MLNETSDEISEILSVEELLVSILILLCWIAAIASFCCKWRRLNDTQTASLAKSTPRNLERIRIVSKECESIIYPRRCVASSSRARSKSESEDLCQIVEQLNNSGEFTQAARQISQSDTLTFWSGKEEN